jgi:phosphoglycolate phosphatase
MFRIRQKAGYVYRRSGKLVYGIADRIGWDGKLNELGDWLYELGLGDSAEPYVMIAGVREMLVTLSKYYPLSIISIRGQKSTFRFLFQFELIPFFSAVATGQTCSHTKPHPAPILWAAERMNVPPSTCLMIGDTVSDIQAGKRAGAQTVGVLWIW